MTKARITVRQCSAGKYFSLMEHRTTYTGKLRLSNSMTYLTDIYRAGGVSELADYYRRLGCDALRNNLLSAIRVS